MVNCKGGAGQASKKKAKKPAATEPEPDPPQEQSPKKPATSKKASKKRDTSADVPTSPPRRKGRKIETNDSTDSEQSSTPSTPSPKKAKARGASSDKPVARKVQQKKTIIASHDMQDSDYSESNASTPPVTPTHCLKSKGSGPLKDKAPMKKGQLKNKRQKAEDVPTTQDTPEVACEVEYMTSSDSDTGVADIETRASQQAKIDKRKGRVHASIKLPAKTEEDLIEFIKDRPLF